VAITGPRLNLSSLAVDCGISHTTAREWLSVLEASYLLVCLPPFFKNFGKRLVKMPKLYFESHGKLQAVEIKSGATFAPDWLMGIKKWQALVGSDALAPWLIYGGNETYEREGLTVIGWRDSLTRHT